MKRILGIISIIFFVMTMSSCYGHRHYGHRGNLPPGQAKKIYGKKSAREFAPGQQKKRGHRKYKGNNGNGRGNSQHYDVQW